MSDPSLLNLHSQQPLVTSHNPIGMGSYFHLSFSMTSEKSRWSRYLPSQHLMQHIHTSSSGSHARHLCHHVREARFANNAFTRIPRCRFCSLNSCKLTKTVIQQEPRGSCQEICRLHRAGIWMTVGNVISAERRETVLNEAVVDPCIERYEESVCRDALAQILGHQLCRHTHQLASLYNVSAVHWCPLCSNLTGSLALMPRTYQAPTNPDS